jgi:hypothetical protein
MGVPHPTLPHVHVTTYDEMIALAREDCFAVVERRMNGEWG